MEYRIPSRLLFSKKRLPKRVIISYILDYVIIIVLSAGFYALDAVEPFHQHFSLQNYTLQYPYAVHERVPIPLAAFICIACPIIVIAVYTLLIDGLLSHQKQEIPPRDGRGLLAGKYRLKDRLWEFNCGVLGLLLSSSAAFVITAALKNATGKPRPDLIDRCRPLPGSADPLVFGLSNSTICNPTDRHVLKDGFRSFPSGHSSTAFAGLFYLSLYLAGKLHVLDNRGEVWKSFIVLIPTLGAALVAISRIMDARHHPFDVISGSMLGMLMAYVAYRQYFPPLSEPWRKGRAYHIRSWATEPTAPQPDKREVARDAGVEPFRSTAMRPDEEQPRIVFTAPEPAAPASNTEQEGNVFRKQISESQRRRMDEMESRRAGPSSSYSTEFDARTPSNTFSKIGSRRGRPTHADGYWSSSSSDHEGDEGDEGVFELQPQYTLTDPQAHIGGLQHTDYRSGLEGFGSDTSYHPQNQSTNFASASTHAPTGNSALGASRHPQRELTGT